MLKVINHVKRNIENLENDYYIPIKIRFNNKINPFVNLWRVINNNSLFEVAVDNRKGTIEYITLVNIDDEKILLSKESFHTKLEIINGLPVCDLLAWQSKETLDIKKDFKVVIGNNFIKFLLSGEVSHKYYKVIRTYMGVNANLELCEVVVANLSKDEMRVLRECLRIIP